MIKTLDIAWVAGFLEGEGHFARSSKGTVVPKITAAQVQREPLDRLQKLFGGGIYYSPAKVSHGRNNSEKWVWFLSGPIAVQICLTLYVLMSPKRKQQIDKALEKWRAAPRRRGYLANACVKGHPLLGANVKLAKSPRGYIHKVCVICSQNHNFKRHQAERRAAALVPATVLPPRCGGDTVACPICKAMFVARNRRHLFCSRECNSKALTIRLAAVRSAAKAA